VSKHLSERSSIEKSLVDARIQLATEQTAIMKQMREAAGFKIEYANQIVAGLEGAAAVLTSIVPAQK
jgi:hypothetical protein